MGIVRARDDSCNNAPIRRLVEFNAGIDLHLELAITDIDEALLKVDFVLILKSGKSAGDLDRCVFGSSSEVILRKPEGIKIPA